MTLADPHSSLADHSSFIDYLMGLAGLSRMVQALAAGGDGDRVVEGAGADDLVHVLLGIASIGSAVETLAEPPGTSQ